MGFGYGRSELKKGGKQMATSEMSIDRGSQSLMPEKITDAGNGNSDDFTDIT